MRLQLGQEWILGELIDGGGFGKVYAAKSAGHESAVAKLVPKASGAEREMLFVDLGKARNVVPIIDRGETEDSWALVMPRAETSLRQHLRKVAGLLSTADAVAVLADVAITVADLDGRVVHRDLKPENVLLPHDCNCASWTAPGPDLSGRYVLSCSNQCEFLLMKNSHHLAHARRTPLECAGLALRIALGVIRSHRLPLLPAGSRMACRLSGLRPASSMKDFF